MKIDRHPPSSLLLTYPVDDSQRHHFIWLYRVFLVPSAISGELIVDRPRYRRANPQLPAAPPKTHHLLAEALKKPMHATPRGALACLSPFASPSRISSRHWPPPPRPHSTLPRMEGNRGGSACECDICPLDGPPCRAFGGAPGGTAIAPLRVCVC